LKLQVKNKSKSPLEAQKSSAAFSMSSMVAYIQPRKLSIVNLLNSKQLGDTAAQPLVSMTMRFVIRFRISYITTKNDVVLG
jgi:hypothetical protein